MEQIAIDILFVETFFNLKLILLMLALISSFFCCCCCCCLPKFEKLSFINCITLIKKIASDLYKAKLSTSFFLIIRLGSEYFMFNHRLISATIYGKITCQITFYQYECMHISIWSRKLK